MMSEISKAAVKTAASESGESVQGKRRKGRAMISQTDDRERVR
jgi:hypothetical protein